MIDELIEQQKPVSVTLIDKSFKKGIVTRFESGLVELKIDKGLFIVPLSSVVSIYYE